MTTRRYHSPGVVLYKTCACGAVHRAGGKVRNPHGSCESCLRARAQERSQRQARAKKRLKSDLSVLRGREVSKAAGHRYHAKLSGPMRPRPQMPNCRCGHPALGSFLVAGKPVTFCKGCKASIEAQMREKQR